MPKELHEIKKFVAGTNLTPSETDISDDAASYSLNIDPVAEDGVLRGISSDSKPITKNASITDTVNGALAFDATSIVLDSTSGFHDGAGVAGAEGFISFIDTNGDVAGCSYSDVNSDGVTLSGVLWLGPGTGGLADGASVFQVAPVNATRMGLINNTGTHHLVYYDPSADKFKKIDDLYGLSGLPIVETMSAEIENNTGTPVFEPHNQELHIGMGNGESDVPRWIGFQRNPQFGVEPLADMIIEDAILRSPTDFPDIYNSVTIGDFIYGIEWRGEYIYKFQKGTNTFIGKSRANFEATQGIAIRNIDADGNKGLWIYDKDGSNLDPDLGTIWAISIQDRDDGGQNIDKSRRIDLQDDTEFEVGDEDWVSDLFQTGVAQASTDKLWIGRYVTDTALSDTTSTGASGEERYVWQIDTPHVDGDSAESKASWNNQYALLTSHTPYQMQRSFKDGAVYTGQYRTETRWDRNTAVGDLRRVTSDHMDENDEDASFGLGMKLMIDEDNKVLILYNGAFNSLKSYKYTDSASVDELTHVNAITLNNYAVGDYDVNAAAVDIHPGYAGGGLIFYGIDSGTQATSGVGWASYTADGTLTHRDTLLNINHQGVGGTGSYSLMVDPINNVLITASGKTNRYNHLSTYEYSGAVDSLAIVARTTLQDYITTEGPNSAADWRHGAIDPEHRTFFLTSNYHAPGVYSFHYSTNGTIDNSVHKDFDSYASYSQLLVHKGATATYLIASTFTGNLRLLEIEADGDLVFKDSQSMSGGVSLGPLAFFPHCDWVLVGRSTASANYYVAQFDEDEEEFNDLGDWTMGGGSDEAGFAYSMLVPEKVSGDLLDPSKLWTAGGHGITALLITGDMHITIPKQMFFECSNVSKVGITWKYEGPLSGDEAYIWHGNGGTNQPTDVIQVRTMTGYIHTGQAHGAYISQMHTEDLTADVQPNLSANDVMFSVYNDATRVYWTAGVVGAETSKVYLAATPSQSDTNNPDSYEILDLTTIDVSEPSISTPDAGTSNLHMFAGNGVGRWMSIPFVGGQVQEWGSAVAIRESTLSITMAQVAGDGYKNGDRVWYRATFLYDGYQESPMGDKGTDASGNEFIDITAARDVEVSITCKRVDLISKRISHVRLYAALFDIAGSDPDLTPPSFYRLVKEQPLDSSFELDASDATNPAWETVRLRVIKDNNTPGNSYEGSTGINEVLDNIYVHYGLSAQTNGYHFVARCYHPQLDDIKNWVFRSGWQTFDSFNIIKDTIRIPTYPVAMAGFAGRLYVFGENNLYRCEPNGMYIEDTFEGIGCLGPDAFVVTEYGMCFADKNNIFVHDGQKPIAIGNKILRGDDKAWQTNSGELGADTEVIFDAKSGSFVVMMKSNGNYFAWAYNLARKRWDLWDVASEPKSTIPGKNGEMFYSNGTDLVHYKGHPANIRTWDWHSKKLTMQTDSQYKIFKKTRVAGHTGDVIGTFVSSEGTPSTAHVSDGSTSGVYTLSGANATAKWIKYQLAGQTGTVDAIGTVFRRRSIK